jgi:hypothetical protein
LAIITYEIQKTYKNLNYCGETVAQFGEKFMSVVMSNRKEPDQIMKNELIIKQNSKCAHCQEILTDTSEVDHIKRVADGGTTVIENLQYLCKLCHNDKCESEEPLNDLPDKNRWESSMSGDVYEGYMCSDKPQNLIFGNGMECEHAIDNVRSRLNGITEPLWDFPKNHILDVIEPYHEEQNMKGVQIFIDAGPGDKHDMLNLFHYQKPMWCPYERAMFILQNCASSENGLITRDDFKLMIVPSETISREERVHVFDIMKTQINRAVDIIDKPRIDEQKRTGARPWFMSENFKKTIFLALIGSWGTQHRISFNAIESTHADDLDGLVTIRRHLGGNVYRFGSETEIVSNTNMYPFHLQCLHFEQMQLAKAYMLINTIPVAPINKKCKLNDQETIEKKLGYKIEICYVTKIY